MDFFVHIGGDQSTLENKKRVTVVHRLLKENKIKKLIDNTEGDNVPEPDMDNSDADIDSNVARTVDV